MTTMIYSELTKTLDERVDSVDVKVYRLLDRRWSLEVHTDKGDHQSWESRFKSANDAVTLATRAMRKQGIEKFSIEIFE